MSEALNSEFSGAGSDQELETITLEFDSPYGRSLWADMAEELAEELGVYFAAKNGGQFDQTLCIEMTKPGYQQLKAAIWEQLSVSDEELEAYYAALNSNVRPV